MLDEKKTCHICSVFNLNELHSRPIVSVRLSNKLFDFCTELRKFVCISVVYFCNFFSLILNLNSIVASSLHSTFMSFSNNGILFTMNKLTASHIINICFAWNGQFDVPQG